MKSLKNKQKDNLYQKKLYIWNQVIFHHNYFSFVFFDQNTSFIEVCFFIYIFV